MGVLSFLTPLFARPPLSLAALRTSTAEHVFDNGEYLMRHSSRRLLHGFSALSLMPGRNAPSVVFFCLPS